MRDIRSQTAQKAITRATRVHHFCDLWARNHHPALLCVILRRQQQRALGPQSNKYGGSAHFSELVGGGLDLREGVDGEVGKNGELCFVWADEGGEGEKFLCGRG